jgi:CHAD domain-containing protein
MCRRQNRLKLSIALARSKAGRDSPGAGLPMRDALPPDKSDGVEPVSPGPSQRLRYGHAASTGVPRAAPKASPIAIDHLMTIRQASAAIVEGCVGHVLAAAEYARNGNDPEGIHQARVAIRRLRAALSICRKSFQTSGRPKVAERLKALQQALGPARDLDVLLEETLASVPDDLRGRRGFEHLVEAAERRRATAYRRARAALASRQCTDLLSLLAPAIACYVDESGAAAPGRSSTIKEFASELLAQRYKKVRKLGHRVRGLDPVEMHELRIRVKKLRYPAEFFGDLWPPECVNEDLGVLKDLQQSLGTAHDLAVAATFVLGLASGAEPDAASAAILVQGYASHRLMRDAASVAELWQRVAGHKRFFKGRHG